MSIKSTDQPIKASVLILAGGKGLRMGSDVPKQFLELQGMPIIERTIQKFADADIINRIVVVVPEEHFSFFKLKLENINISTTIDLISGGKERQESSFKGLLFLADNAPPDVVLIHDAVRPFISTEMITEVSKAAFTAGAAIVAVNAVSTIIRGEGNYVAEVLDRSSVYEVQTPQAFDFKKIIKLHREARENGITNATDDAQFFVQKGDKVKICDGSVDNIKITSPKDIDLGLKILSRSEK